MEKFVDVSVIKKANVYFEGKVTSRTIFFENGEKKTLGIMLPGKYEFGTGEKEIMEILGGDLKVKLPNSDIWSTYKEGDTFEVEKNSSFKLIVNEIVDYCCSYIEV